ncbi:hypothetical protein [Thiorhodovibrio frisius]|uniref:Uncharacterized protein n=1 Tax=Thiorhodovibrio frisius TaxID=631362 RepID=H8Z1V6_9GAMM|nr:hypothetical protein [Thiorhodovibrio frisius]EIC22584.1 hypothetical protein Thi970DRAFT_02856 [Thiorhodovibrio frisius]WPL20025.1 hypothetical protein Thiofri_00076 [Thiorhodovibrio frisius]
MFTRLFRSRSSGSQKPAPIKILLHLGMPKCGSSALQTFLSAPAFEGLTGERCAYLVLKKDGELLWGDSLLQHARTSPYGYAASARAEDVRAISPQQQRNARATLKRLGQDYEWLIFSSESWGPKAHLFADDWLLADPAFEVHLLAYVRPQIEWLNSAWWQWGAWTRLQPRPWINRMRQSVQWHRLLRHWADKPWVSSLTVRLLDDDIVADAMAYLGYALEQRPRINQGLPAIVLRLYQRHRQLRPGPHDSAMDFVLARQLHLQAQGTPWIIGPGFATELVECFHEDNQQLAQLVSPDQREHLLADPRWWQADVYQQRPLAKLNVPKLNAQELEHLCVVAMEAIFRLDAEVRELRARADVSA